MFAYAATMVEKSCCSAKNADMLYIVTENANELIGIAIKIIVGIVVILEMLRKILWCLQLRQGTLD